MVIAKPVTLFRFACGLLATPFQIFFLAQAPQGLSRPSSGGRISVGARFLTQPLAAFRGRPISETTLRVAFCMALRAISQHSCSSKKTPPPCRFRQKRGCLIYAALPDCAGLTCTVRPAWSGARNDPRRPSGSFRTVPWRGRGRHGTDGCNGSRWPGSPGILPSCQPWRSG